MINIFPDKNKKPSFDIKTDPKKRKSAPLNTPTSANPTAFQDTVGEVLKAKEWNKNIDDTIEELDALQSTLIHNPSIAVIEQYREIIGNLLNNLLDNYQASTFHRGVKNRVQLKIWHTINTELDNLAHNVIKNNVAGFQALSKINLIKGLMIDLKIGKN